MYEIYVFCCPKRGGRISVMTVIREPDEICKIIACLEGHGRGPPKAGFMKINLPQARARVGEGMIFMSGAAQYRSAA